MCVYKYICAREREGKERIVREGREVIPTERLEGPLVNGRSTSCDRGQGPLMRTAS